jgi:hypothetical protein
MGPIRGIVVLTGCLRIELMVDRGQRRETEHCLNKFQDGTVLV